MGRFITILGNRPYKKKTFLKQYKVEWVNLQGSLEASLEQVFLKVKKVIFIVLPPTILRIIDKFYF